MQSTTQQPSPQSPWSCSIPENLCNHHRTQTKYPQPQSAHLNLKSPFTKTFTSSLLNPFHRTCKTNRNPRRNKIKPNSNSLPHGHSFVFCHRAIPSMQPINPDQAEPSSDMQHPSRVRLHREAHIPHHRHHKLTITRCRPAATRRPMLEFQMS